METRSCCCFFHSFTIVFSNVDITQSTVLSQLLKGTNSAQNYLQPQCLGGQTLAIIESCDVLSVVAALQHQAESSLLPLQLQNAASQLLHGCQHHQQHHQLPLSSLHMPHR
jgi:hypothetical protein